MKLPSIFLAYIIALSGQNIAGEIRRSVIYHNHIVMLQIDPEKRISIDEAVQHPYVKLWFIDSEWNAPLPENRYDPQNDLVERPIEQWRG
uniref:Uncharacterized protein n=1 Tax=Parascaris equorum TaxID=6256 RepID=A0A914R6A2_PAREQ